MAQSPRFVDVVDFIFNPCKPCSINNSTWLRKDENNFHPKKEELQTASSQSGSKLIQEITVVIHPHDRIGVGTKP